MGSLRDQLAELVDRTVREVNEDLELDDGTKIGAETTAVLYGPGATIDSMTLVSLIVAVEETLRSEMGLSVTLANDRAMSMQRSPFSTLGSLTDYLVEVVEEARKS